MALTRRSVLQMALAPRASPRCHSCRIWHRPHREFIPGTDNKLVYVPDELGNTVIDSSHAGYSGGGVAIPSIPVRETIWPVARRQH
jgi:hypothetical protein